MPELEINYLLFTVYCLLFTKEYLENKVLAWWWKDPDPGGPKTCTYV